MADESSKKAALELAQQVQTKYKEDLQNKKKYDDEQAFLMKQTNFARELDKFKQSRITSTPGPDGKPQQETDWDRSTRKGKEGSSSETSAYNSEWKIAMLGLVAMLVEWNKAINNSVTEFAMTPKFVIQHQLLPEVWKKISSPFQSEPEAVLPVLIHEVKMSDKNALEVNLTLKGREATTTFDDQFKRVVGEWLREQGYRPDPNPANKDQFVDSKGEVLTSAAFETLKKDPDHGLEHFLNETSELQFQPRM
jgi:hypothetical protein